MHNVIVVGKETLVSINDVLFCAGGGVGAVFQDVVSYFNEFRCLTDMQNKIFLRKAGSSAKNGEII